ncbi:MAG TPA: hypothetical protein VG387_15190 [Rhizomicrobium sp.]|nr:hypothetical protein [Rhizomicrobium sp.]
MMPRLSRNAPPHEAPPHSAPPSTLVREYALPLDRAAAPLHVILRLSIPGFPQPMRQATYGEHVGNQVIALSQTLVADSTDLGLTWAMQPVRLAQPPRACFTTSRGTHLVCTHVAKEIPSSALIYRFDAAWRQLGEPFRVPSPWHGSASIGEANGVIMFAEYPDNAAKYRAAPMPILPAQVWRSRDDGANWQVAKTVSSDQIRHLHTLVPEPAAPGRWWLSSGDRDTEVFVWRSDDDGDSWIDVTEAAPDVPMAPRVKRYARAVQRMTDLAFHDGWMIWGADDWLGLSAKNSDERPMPGSRIFRARTTGPWKVEDVGYCGKPVRNIIDVGPAFLLTTEAKHIDMGARPDVFLIFKDDITKVHHVAQIDNYATRGSGFTYSLASRTAQDGTFFSHRGGSDAFRSETRMLKWELIFS